ncbi:MAG TPA: amidohydrolase [Vicinamibacteria bacterium]
MFRILALVLSLQEPPVDLVLVDAKVATMESADDFAQAVAVRGRRIVRVGTNEEVRALAGPETEVLSLGGKLVLPGLVDSHVHFLGGSLSLDQLDVSRADLPEIQKRLSERIRSRPQEAWVVGRGWSYAAIPGRLPNHADLDAVSKDKPVFLVAYDGHTAWVNENALELAGITAATPQPEFGEIVHDENGQPTGLLKETGAMNLVRSRIPETTHEDKRRALLRGLAEARRLGLTGIQNASGNEEELGLYEELDREGLLTLRTITALRMAPDLTEADLESYERLRKKYASGNVRAGTVKAFIDGVVETHTAAMLEPYADDSSQRGETAMPVSELERLVLELDRRKFQIYVHAIGDRGVRVTLDAYDRARRENPGWDRRHRIEHIEVISKEDIPRFGSSGTLAGMQATHWFPTPQSEAGVWARNVGKERLPLAFNWQAIADSGGRLTFGSDWPVATLNPLVGLRNATARKDQKLDPYRALRAYTIDAAYASYSENDLGSVRAGKLADLVVLSRDVFTIDPAEIHEVEALFTIFDGRVVYRSDAASE